MSKQWSYEKVKNVTPYLRICDDNDDNENRSKSHPTKEDSDTLL
jgi:hypothetical protein